MKSFTLRISLAASLLILLSLVGALPTRSDSGQAQFNRQSEDRAAKGPARPGVKQLSYRSPGATHKLQLPADDADIEQRLMSSRSARKAKKYGAYSLVEVTEAELSSMNASTLDRANLRDDLNLMMLRPGQIDTTGPEPIIANDLRQNETGLRALHLVQLFGPPTPESLAALTATGAKVVGYVPNNAYLMWTTRAERRQLHALRQSADGSSLVQWDGPYHPAYKVDPHIKLDSVEQVSASIQILDTPESDNTVSLVKSIANKILMPEFRAAGAVRIKVLAESYRLKELAQMPDVLAIEPWSPMHLMDERADQIVAGALSSSTVNNILVSQPTGPGYLAFLNSLGFNTDFDFVVDVGDTGFDSGTADAAKVHPDFLNAAASSRVAYLHDFTQDSHGGAPFEATGVIADSAKEVRVMLVWTDPPGSSVTNAPYVNQLNLEVIAGGVVYSGNHFSGQYSTAGGQKDFSNNVQGVRLPAGTTGPIVIRVRPTIIAGDGVPGNFSPLDQDFALVVTNSRETAIPVLTVEPSGDVAAGVTVQHADGKTDASLIAGESARITVTVRNQSQTTEATVQGATLTLGSTQSSAAFNAIAPGQTGTNTTPFQIQIPSGLRCGSVANLQLQVDTSAGRFTLPVRVQVGRFSQAGGPAERLLFDDVDNGGVKWKHKGGFDSIQGPATSGTMSFHVQDAGKDKNDSQLAQLFMKKVVTIPDNAGQVRLSFFHIFNFEPGFDGGVLELSTDEGETWQDAGSLILVGGYDGTVTADSNNPLGTRAAWTARGRPGVFSQVVVDLSGFAGKRVKLKFLAGFDDAAGILNGYTGWFIDDIQITAVMYSCGQSQAANEANEPAENLQSRRPERRAIPRIE